MRMHWKAVVRKCFVQQRCHAAPTCEELLYSVKAVLQCQRLRCVSLFSDRQKSTEEAYTNIQNPPLRYCSKVSKPFCSASGSTATAPV